MAGKKAKKILYWVDGRTVTDEQQDEANSLQGTVMFRNAQFVPEDGSIEEFDDLAGPAIPKRYAKALAERDTVEEVDKPKSPEALAGPDAESGTNQVAKQDSAWQTGPAKGKK